MTRVGTSFDEYMATHAGADVVFSGRPADADTLVINGATIVYARGSLADQDADVVAIAALINASTDILLDGLVSAAALPTGTATELRLTADVAGTTANAYLLDASDMANAAADGATFTGGTDQANTEIMVVPHVIDASDVPLGVITMETPFTRIMEFTSTFHDAGILTADLPTFAPSGGTLTITKGSGTTWAAGDIFTVTIKGYTTARVTS